MLGNVSKVFSVLGPGSRAPWFRLDPRRLWGKLLVERTGCFVHPVRSLPGEEERSRAGNDKVKPSPWFERGLCVRGDNRCNRPVSFKLISTNGNRAGSEVPSLWNWGQVFGIACPVGSGAKGC